MQQNEPLIAKFGVDTAEKCTIENLQIRAKFAAWSNQCGRLEDELRAQGLAVQIEPGQLN